MYTAALLPNYNTFMLMLVSSSWEGEITKPGSKEQHVFLQVKWSNRCGKMDHTLACERNCFPQHRPPLWYWLPENKLFPSQIQQRSTSDRTTSRLCCPSTAFLHPGKAEGNLPVWQANHTALLQAFPALLVSPSVLLQLKGSNSEPGFERGEEHKFAGI